jgi:aspartokinase
MTFDERLETTPGVVSFIYGLLAEHGINVVEEMSCWTELMLVVAEEDAARTIRLLNSISGRETKRALSPREALEESM